MGVRQAEFGSEPVRAFVSLAFDQKRIVEGNNEIKRPFG